MMFPFRRAAVAAAAFSLGATALAQAPAAGALSEVTVTGNPLGATDMVVPVEQSSGTGLLLRRQSTLGETLSGMAGVSSTYFGPTASRPVIRGLDGDRLRVLQNSGATHDVSSLSYDHAVAADPIAVERIEVLRGPGALLYGGNAIGGVVNLIDNRIPREPLQGVTGRVDAGLASGNRERSAAALVEGGTDRVGLHVDAFDRTADPARVPVPLPCIQGGVETVARRLCNAQADTRGAAVGGSLFFDRGYLGASVEQFRSDYGSVAEDEVTLGLRSTRVAVQGEVRRLPGWIESVKAQAGQTRYRHTEFDAGEPGTLFTNRGSDLRLEARHARLGPLEGVVGLQAEQGRFEALGDEAFAPPSRTRQRALFLYEELPTGWGKLLFGARREWVDVESLGSDELPRFGAARRSFGPASASVGGLWKLAPAWQLTGTLARSQRAPRDYELFADGPHLATAGYEVGDAALGLERSTSAELGAQWTQGHDKARVGVFQTRFSNYIALLSTGLARDAQGNGAGTGVADCGDGTSAESGCASGVLPEFAYRGVRARFRGLEAEGVKRLLQGPQTLDLEWRGDLVRAENVTLGEPLPRIAPVRVGATLAWAQGPWGARVGADHWARQERVPAGTAPVAGYTLVSAAVTLRAKAGPSNLLWYLRLDNATDRLAYSATSILTQSVPGRVPLPGRSLKVGLRADF
ncbi:MAG TPA: TonB-dependent receptor [Ramlibacter sp.]|uniref:TonB-dependent receptor n=1 Tax=Ramlibacter sp. TaxID=1917967 RepID=UPI002D4F8B42|nr:TonB-dependent receptor [Ramlibacter sp.]HZY20206.1 TonB-dependent receptor [Ramlibacter sp.]